jgi:hypothetical protein
MAGPEQLQPDRRSCRRRITLQTVHCCCLYVSFVVWRWQHCLHSDRRAAAGGFSRTGPPSSQPPVIVASWSEKSGEVKGHHNVKPEFWTLKTYSAPS